MSEDDMKYFTNKQVGKTYVSKRINNPTSPESPLRIASKVIDTQERYHEAQLKDEVVLRLTPTERHEVVAKFWETSRNFQVLTIQRWSKKTGFPVRENFSFVGDEIPSLLNFLSNVVNIYFPDAKGINIADSQLNQITATDDQAEALLKGNLDLLVNLAENQITERDIVALGYRKKQLERFEKLLTDDQYFAKQLNDSTPEKVWQDFFEANPWIFGYGLSLIFLDAFDDKRLEQIVSGHSLGSTGKRVDAIMKTKAEISSMCFIEIKRHDEAILDPKPYRAGAWSPSKHLIGGIAQIQATVSAAINNLTEKFEPNDRLGNPTGERIYAFEPRSYLVIGRQSEFDTEHGTNEDKYRSFETFRRNLRNPEVVTYDELLHRARFIVSSASSDELEPSPDIDRDGMEMDEEIPF